MKENSTKKNLALSAVSILLCVVMLVGLTFAWFTDSVTNKGNKIQAGTLNIDLQVKDETGEYQSVKDSEKPIFDYTKWEPGYTVVKNVKVSTTGNLALEYTLDIVSKGEVSELADVIDVYYAPKEVTVADRNDLSELNNLGTLGEVFAGAEGTKVNDTLIPGTNAEDFATIVLKMRETAGNEYKNLAIGEFDLRLFATQHTYEEDSFGSDYDENAPLIYPGGVTEESFGDKDIVYANGEYYDNFKEAMTALNADGGGTLYFKKDAVVDFNTHLDVKDDLTIYANGADFKGKDISIGTYASPVEKETTISIYDAKNLTVWGQPTDRGDIWNVNMTNCVNEGAGLLMYRGGNDKDTINFTATNCQVNGVMDALHTTASGTVTVKNCTFTDIDAGINIAYKEMREMNVVVENSTFVSCGKVDIANDYFAPVRFVNNWLGDLNVSLKNNVFVDTVGTNGDILLGDYRSAKLSFDLTCEIETSDNVMLKNSKEAPRSVGSGTYGLKK